MRAIAMTAVMIAFAASLPFAQDPVRTPSRSAETLPASGGWIAAGIHDNGAGIVAVGAGHFSRHYGSPQALLIDRDGRAVVLQSEGTRWAPHVVVEDGAMLTGWAFGDLDPAIEGGELYIGGRSGKLYRVHASGPENWESRMVLAADGETLGRLAMGDFLAQRPGLELVSFASSGPVLLVTPDERGELHAARVGCFASRVRSCVTIPGDDGRSDRAAALAQDGEISVVSFQEGGSSRRVVSRESVTPARIARKPRESRGATDLREVLYAARVDGLVLRYCEQEDGSWVREPIYLCAEGIGGIAAGRFHREAGIESVAIYTNGGKIQILSRPVAGSWAAETVFRDDRGGGHWLVAYDVDERNGTLELIGGGPGKRLVVLGRAAGYGLSGVAADPDAAGLAVQ